MRPWAARADLGLFFLLGFLLWLLNHPYQGIWHDARIYGLLAAHWLNPQALAGDLFFRFGSQGELSLFTPIFGELVRWLGLSRAAWWVVLGGGLLWIAACLALARTMLGTGFSARFAVMLGAVMVMSYSPNESTFVLGESFATARSWAIPLGLASVAALAANRQGWSLVLSIGAMALHPLHGVWAVALWVLVRMRITAAVILTLLPLVAVLLLGAMNVDLPHLRLMTGDWLEFARAARDIVFKPLLQSRLTVYLGMLMALWLGARHGREQWRPLYLRLLLLGASGIGLGLLSSFAFPLEIVVQAQPWRVMTLMIPMAAVAMIDVGRCAWQSPVTGRLLVGGVAVLASMGSYWLPGVLCALGIASLLPGEWRIRIERWILHWRRWLVGSLAVLALSVVPRVLAGWEIAGNQWLNPWWTGAESLLGLVSGGSWHLAAILAVVLGWLGGNGAADTSRKPARVATLVAGCSMTALAVLTTLYQWDRRSEHYRLEEARYLNPSRPPHPFLEWIAPGNTVFWPQRELTIWFDLGTASYFGDIQQTGKVFSPAKFYESQRREAWLAGGADPRHLCADPILDWVVVTRSEPLLEAQAVSEGAYLYACSRLRNPLSAPTAS